MNATNKPGAPFTIVGESESSGACWSCGQMLAAHFCQACGKVQPARPTDFFSFFGLPPKLNLDSAALEREFYKLSRQLHPDLYARASREEQQWSLEKSSQLNDAYRTLKDPITRTQYLLRLEGVQLEEQSKAATEQARQSGQQKKQVVPPELLEEVFELNLQLEELRLEKQMGERDPELARELEGTRAGLQARLQALADELQGYWQEWDALVDRGDASPQERKAVRDKMVGLLNRRTYISNLVRDVNDALEDW